MEINVLNNTSAKRDVNNKLCESSVFYNSLFLVFNNFLFMSLTTGKFYKQLFIINRQFP